MSGSRTAVPVTAALASTSPLSTPTTESMAGATQASDDAGTAQGRWWGEEDLTGMTAERLGLQQERATTGRLVSHGNQPNLQDPSPSTRRTPVLRPTASLFTPASSLSTKRASEVDRSTRPASSAEEGFQYNHEEYRRSSPDAFVYQTKPTWPSLGVNSKSSGPSSASRVDLETPKLDSPLLSAEEKEKILQLASSPKPTRAVPISCPAVAASEPQKDASYAHNQAGSTTEAALAAQMPEARPTSSSQSGPVSLSRPPSSMAIGDTALLTAQTSPDVSLTSSVRSTRSRSSDSTSLVPYEGSSEEDETSSEAEEQSATPTADVSLEVPSTPPEEPAAAVEPTKPAIKTESETSLEDQVRPAMAVSDGEHDREVGTLAQAQKSAKDHAAKNAEEVVDRERKLARAQSPRRISRQGAVARSMRRDANVPAQDEDEGTPNETVGAAVAEPSSLPSSGLLPVETSATSLPHPDKLETIGSEAVQHELPATTNREPPPSPTSTFSDMPAFGLDQRVRPFNPFAAPFVPPTAYQPGAVPASVAPIPAAQALVPPSAVLGQAHPVGPFGPVAPVAAKPIGTVDVQCHTLGNLLRQAMHENGVLHHKIAKYDHGLKAEQERRATIARELDEFKAEHNRVLRHGNPTPLQHRQITELEATVARGNGELERLRRELNAMGTSLARVQKEHAASLRHEKDNFTSEQRKWEVAVKMRDERIEALQQKHQADEGKLAALQAEHEAETARVKNLLESERKQRADACETVADATKAPMLQVVANLETAESRLRQSEVEQEQLRGDCDKLRNELDDLQRRHETLTRLHEGQKDVLETQSKKLKEAVSEQELLRTSLTVCQDELATLRQEEKKIRETRDRFGTMLKSTSQEKSEIERKFRAELDKVQREKADVEAKLNAELDKLVKELASLKRDLTDAVREIVHVEGERYRSDSIAVDSFEYALSGMQSLRRLFEEEQRRSSDLEADYAKLKKACSDRIQELEQLLHAREAELEGAMKADGDKAADRAAKEELAVNKALLKDLQDEHRRLKLDLKDHLEQRRKVETQLDTERAGNEKLHVDVKRLQKLADLHKTAELAALETNDQLKKRASDLEDRQTTLGSLLVRARSERDTAKKDLEDLIREKARGEEEKTDAERKVAMLEDKVESLASELEAAKAVASSITLDTKRPFASKVKQIAALRGTT